MKIESKFFNDVRNRIRSKITRYQSEEYESERKVVGDSILDTIKFGKSTTIFIVGPQGVGKTKMMNTILETMSEHQSIREQYQVIKLDGYLQETDELAVQHIVKALNSNLLSENEFTGSALEYLEYIVQSLHQADCSRKSLIIIFDNFHIFCDNEKQLLYNLLDMVNRPSASISVVGIANNSSCIDTLHARTQSRLATTNVFLNPKTNVDNRLDLIQNLFTLDKPTVPMKKNWNKSVEQIRHDPKMRELITNLSELSWSCGLFIQFLHNALLYLDEEHTLTVDTFKNAFNDFNLDVMNLNYKLKNLTTLELCLVIAIHHICSDHETNVFNFETVYECYHKVAQKTGSLPQVDRILALMAFKNLKKQGFIKSKRAAELDSTPFEYDMHELLIPRKQIKEHIQNLPNMPAELKQWMDSSLHTQ